MAEPLQNVRTATSVPLEHKAYYAIEFPGLVSSEAVPKAIERMGGPQIVTETVRKGLKLDLRLKDNDLWAHPPNGHTATTHNLLLKVVRRRRKAKPQDDPGSSAKASAGQFTANVLGVTQKTIRFRNPIDFQFRPPQDDPIVELREALERLDSKHILAYRLPRVKEEYAISQEEQEERDAPSSSVARIFPPPLFQRLEIPTNYNFKANPSSVQQTLIDKNTGEVTTRLVNSGKLVDGYPVAIRFSDPTPMTAGEEREALRPLVRPSLQRRLEELLQERPIWTRLGLTNQLSAQDARTLWNSKVAWAVCSYIFQDGPWRDTVVRLGYDPRQDPEAVKYQIASLRNFKNPALRHSIFNKPTQPTNGDKDPLAHEFDGVTVRMTGTFQFCDIHDPLVRRYLDDPANRTAECDVHDGWLNHVTAERVKNIMKFKHQRLIDVGIGPTEEECAALLVPDDEYMGTRLHTAATKHSNGPRSKKGPKRKKKDMPFEELAARRLELAVSRMEQTEDGGRMEEAED